MNPTRTVVILAGLIALTAAVVSLTHHSVPHLPQAPPNARPAAVAAASQTPTAPAAAPQAASRDADGGGALVDICGVGRVRLDKDDPSGMEYVSALAQPAEARWIAALQASSDTHARVAGLVLAGPEQAEAMAQLALQNTDPALYDFALGACARTEHAGAACAQISPEGWAELDTDNAVPWLQVARRARLAAGPAREAAAMQRAAGAHRVDDYNFSLLADALPSLPSDMGMAEKYLLAIEAIGFEAARGASQYPEASKYCSREAVNDVRVAEECRTLANLFESHGSTMRDLVEAKAIGGRAGWSQQRVDAAMKYFAALMAEVEQTEPATAEARWSCASLSAANDYLRDLAQRGEINALRERYERSGVSVPELAQQHRDYIEKLMQRASALQ